MHVNHWWQVIGTWYMGKGVPAVFKSAHIMVKIAGCQRRIENDGIKTKRGELGGNNDVFGSHRDDDDGTYEYR